MDWHLSFRIFLAAYFFILEFSKCFPVDDFNEDFIWESVFEFTDFFKWISSLDWGIVSKLGIFRLADFHNFDSYSPSRIRYDYSRKSVCTDGERVSSNSSWYSALSVRIRADHGSDSFCLPRSERGSDKSVSVIVVPGWLRHSSVRGGAGVTRFARSGWIWASIIPQEKRETAGSPAIVDFVRFSDRSAVEGRWKMDVITFTPTKLYDVVRFCYLYVSLCRYSW